MHAAVSVPREIWYMYGFVDDALRNTVQSVNVSARQCRVSVFIARQHTYPRYWYSKSVCLSVCLSISPSVRPLRSGILWKRLNVLLSSCCVMPGNIRSGGKLCVRLIAKATRISHVKFHCNRLTTVQDTRLRKSHFWHTL